MYAICGTARKVSTTAPLVPQHVQTPGAWLSPGTSTAPQNSQTPGSHVRLPLRGKTDPLLCAPSPPFYPELFPAPADDPAPELPASSPAAAPRNGDAQGQRVRPVALRGAGGRTGSAEGGMVRHGLGDEYPAQPGAGRRLHRQGAEDGAGPRRGARGCSAPPRPHPGSEPRARQSRGQTRRAEAPEPPEPCGGRARPYCRCGARAGAEDGQARGSRPDAPMPRCGRGRAAPSPLSPPPPGPPSAAETKHRPRSGPGARGFVCRGRAPAAPPPPRCPLRARSVPAGEARGAARPPRPQHRAARGAAPPGGREGRGAAGPPRCPRLKATAAQDPLRRPSAPPRPRRDRTGVPAPSLARPSSATMSSHSAPQPRPRSLSSVHALTQRPPKCPQSPQTTIHIPKHSISDPQSSPLCDTRGHSSAWTWTCAPQTALFSVPKGTTSSMWVPLWGAGTAAPSNLNAHPQEGHPCLPCSALLCLSLTKIPTFVPFFSLCLPSHQEPCCRVGSSPGW